MTVLKPLCGSMLEPVDATPAQLDNAPLRATYFERSADVVSP